MSSDLNSRATAVFEWRDVMGSDGAYQVSSDGQVRRVARVVMTKQGPARLRQQPMKLLSRKGYDLVTLRYPGGSRMRPVHQLVLEAFVGPKPDGMVCRHLNGVRNDNRVENLSWGTPQQNSDDMLAHGTRQTAQGHHASIAYEDCARIAAMLNSGMSAREVARQSSASRSTVRSIAKGQHWSSATIPVKYDANGQQAKGYAGRRKLKPDDLREVLRSLEEGKSCVSVAARFGVSRALIRKIAQGEHKGRDGSGEGER